MSEPEFSFADYEQYDENMRDSCINCEGCPDCQPLSGSQADDLMEAFRDLLHNPIR